MLTFTTPGNNTFVLYNNAKQLPIKRYAEAQKYYLMDAGVGSDMEAISSRYARLHAFLAEEKNNEASKEAENLHFTHYSMLEGINFKSYSFCCLLHSLNGKVFNDYSEEGISAILKEIEDTDLTQQMLEELVEDVKKKFLTN